MPWASRCSCTRPASPAFPNTAREPGSNGLAIDANGRLLCCEHGDRRVSVLTTNRGKRTLADQFDGKRFNSPNDLAIHSNGDVYSTGPGGVLVIAPDGTLLGRVLTGRPTANVAFGGPGGNQLFITADDLLLRVRLTAR